MGDCTGDACLHACTASNTKLTSKQKHGQGHQDELKNNPAGILNQQVVRQNTYHSTSNMI